VGKIKTRRTQLYLEESFYQFLKKEARKYGSIAAVVRRLIEEKMRMVGEYKEDPIFKLGENPGSSGFKDVSEYHDQYLYGAKK
jgi:hypothetical protein